MALRADVLLVFRQHARPARPLSPSADHVMHMERSTLAAAVLSNHLALPPAPLLRFVAAFLVERRPLPITVDLVERTRARLRARVKHPYTPSSVSARNGPGFGGSIVTAVASACCAKLSIV